MSYSLMRYFVTLPFRHFGDDNQPTYVSHKDPHTHFVLEMQIKRDWPVDADEYPISPPDGGNLDREYAYYGCPEPDGWRYA